VRRKKPLVIDAMYAWIVTDPDGEENVCIAEMGSVFLPLVSPDWTRIKGFRQQAEIARKKTRQSVRLVKFTQREVLEEL
jgi:hypothetical protein